jgi:predicted RNase H-like HicB family nuclease
MNTYVALIRKASDSDYSVDFPDVPGCVTAGRDLDEALAFAREALAGHLQLLAEDGEALPEASSLEAVMADPENRDAVAALVPAPMIRGKAVRVNVMIDEYLLKSIDKLAGDRGRSEFLAEAARARVSDAGRQMPAKTLAAARVRRDQAAKVATDIGRRQRSATHATIKAGKDVRDVQKSAVGRVPASKRKKGQAVAARPGGKTAR